MLRIPESWKKKLEMINSKRRKLVRKDGKSFSSQDLIREAIDARYQLSKGNEKKVH